MGCKKVSAGCKNCYMFRDMPRFGRDPAIVVRASEGTFRNPLKWKKTGKLHPGARIFTCSWSDWFIEQADPWRDEAWRIIKVTPEFTYLILTKRPERIAGHLPHDWGSGYRNVWLLVSAEDNEQLKKRWEILERIRATVRGVSAEPLLGPMSILDTIPASVVPDWIIGGGESGMNPRPAQLKWFTDLAAECVRLGIPYFHKQHGGMRKIDGAWGGRELDGRTWSEFPA